MPFLDWVDKAQAVSSAAILSRAGSVHLDPPFTKQSKNKRLILVTRLERFYPRFFNVPDQRAKTKRENGLQWQS